ncbi:hypothetical protein TNCV_3580401 [Trichonephila clavipes]|nr:hypothetical protein TNCV_3580401 [Trichonephila clavipes]
MFNKTVHTPRHDRDKSDFSVVQQRIGEGVIGAKPTSDILALHANWDGRGVGRAEGRAKPRSSIQISIEERMREQRNETSVQRLN